MQGEVPENYSQQIEHVLAVAFTCRSVVKYQMLLSGEQQKDLLADIDLALHILLGQLVRGASHSIKMASSPLEQEQKPAEAAPIDSPDDENAGQKNEPQVLQMLYRMYHSCIHNDLPAFVMRYKDALTAIKEVRSSIKDSPQNLRQGGGPSGELLESAEGFISDLYYMFLEFMRLLSSTLQENDVHIDTEEVAPVREYPPAKETSERQDIRVLLEVYEKHQQLHVEGTISSRLMKTIIFLTFLEEHFSNNFDKRDEIIVQLNNASKLLSDVSRILSGYEDAIAALLRPK